MGGLLVAAGLLPAQAQLGASLAVESDHRFRGVSLSDGQPDLQASLAWDHPSGWYAGASVSGAEIERGRRGLALLGQVGRAWRDGLPGGLGGELGLSAAHFTASAGYDYTEAYAGLLGDGWSARLAASPDYFGRGTHSLYAEFEAVRSLTAQGRWRGFAHLGALQLSGGPPALARSRIDARIGFGLNLGEFDLQAAWVAASRVATYPAADETQRRRTVVLTVAAFF